MLWAALQAVDSLKILFCPFLPFSSQALHEQLGYDGLIAGPLELHEQTEPNGASHLVLTCEPESWTGRWQPSQLPEGQPLPVPKPLFRKLEPSIVEEEVARLVAKN